MRLLLDTHIFLWAVTGAAELKPDTKKVLEAADEVYVSAASIWEISIKAALGKLQANVDEMVRAIEQTGFTHLPISATHAAGVFALPMHHNDPFDRLLVAQALAEPLKLLTADPLVARYSDLVLLV